MNLTEQVNNIINNTPSKINFQKCKSYEEAYAVFQKLVKKGLVSKRGNCLLPIEYQGSSILINNFNETTNKY